jgi:hypothetical protein
MITLSYCLLQTPSGHEAIAYSEQTPIIRFYGYSSKLHSQSLNPFSWGLSVDQVRRPTLTRYCHLGQRHDCHTDTNFNCSDRAIVASEEISAAELNKYLLSTVL